MAQTNQCSYCDSKLAILENRMDSMERRLDARIDNADRREEDYRKTIERWQEQQDKRLDKLEDADDNFQRDATNNERTKFGIWVTVVVALGTTLIGSVLTLLFSKFQ